MNRRVWTPDQIRALGSSTDLVTAGQILGMGRTKSHELARAGRFPVPLLRHGHRYRVPVAGLLHVLGITASPATTGSEDWPSPGSRASIDPTTPADCAQE